MQWDQVRELLALQDRLDQLLEGQAPGWSPPVDLFESEDGYVVAVELPGLTREDVKIEAQGDRLVVSGSRPVPAVAPQRYHQVERGHGAFSRAFAFAHPIDVDHITAEVQHGVLTVSVPKSRRPDARTITVG